MFRIASIKGLIFGLMVGSSQAHSQTTQPVPTPSPEVKKVLMGALASSARVLPAFRMNEVESKVERAEVLGKQMPDVRWSVLSPALVDAESAQIRMNAVVNVVNSQRWICDQVDKDPMKVVSVVSGLYRASVLLKESADSACYWDTKTATSRPSVDPCEVTNAFFFAASSMDKVIAQCLGSKDRGALARLESQAEAALRAIEATRAQTVENGRGIDRVNTNVLANRAVIAETKEKVIANGRAIEGVNQGVTANGRAIEGVNKGVIANGLAIEKAYKSLSEFRSDVSKSFADQIERDIADQLSKMNFPHTLYMPTVLGGKLELARDLVKEAIEAHERAGFKDKLYVNWARSHLNRADHHISKKNYLQAARHLGKGYRDLISIANHGSIFDPLWWLSL